VARPGPVLAALCGIVAVAFHGLGTAVLWSVVGFFLGKSIRSTLRTFGRGGTP
jgi:hypothetical protein